MRYHPSFVPLILLSIIIGGSISIINTSAQEKSKSPLDVSITNSFNTGYVVGSPLVDISKSEEKPKAAEPFKSMIRMKESAILTCIAWELPKTGVLRIGGKGATDGCGNFAAKHVEDLDVEFTDLDGKRWKARWEEVKPVK